MFTPARAWGAAAAVLLVLTACLPSERNEPSASSQRTRPNILVIVTDDQRAETLSVMPATRRFFAAGGTTFTDAFATTPLCCPSRASIMTGLYAHNHGVRSNLAATPPQEQIDLETMVQHHLAGAGYRTGLAGKFLNGWDLNIDPPDLDRWALLSKEYNDPDVNLNGELDTLDGYSTDLLADISVRFLEGFESEGDQEPWFLYVAPVAPHPPFEPAPKYARAPVPAWEPDRAVRESNLSDKPDYLYTTRQVGTSVPMRLRTGGDTAAKGRTIRKLQLRTLMSVDDLVERLTTTLRELEEERDTLAIFLSDNGYLWGEHGAISKRLPYTPSIGIPLLLRYPDRVRAGVRSDRLVANIDVAPTILDAAGVSVDGGPPMDGKSLLGEDGHRQLLFEHWHAPSAGVPEWYSVRGPRFQYVEYRNSKGRATFREFYDLISDPLQLTNVLADADAGNDPSPARLRALETDIERSRICEGTNCP